MFQQWHGISTGWASWVQERNTDSEQEGNADSHSAQSEAQASRQIEAQTSGGGSTTHGGSRPKGTAQQSTRLTLLVTHSLATKLG